jgi:hypothetical protein
MGQKAGGESLSARRCREPPWQWEKWGQWEQKPVFIHDLFRYNVNPVSQIVAKSSVPMLPCVNAEQLFGQPVIEPSQSMDAIETPARQKNGSVRICLSSEKGNHPSHE